jgi:hypothetical protein
MTSLPPAKRAQYDQVLTEAIDGLLIQAAELDDLDVIEANVALMNDLFERLTASELAASAAALAIRLHRSEATR